MSSIQEAAVLDFATGFLRWRGGLITVGIVAEGFFKLTHASQKPIVGECIVFTK
jgi:hypothetical protein